MATTAETKTDVLNALERLDVSKMSPAQRRVFRENARRFRTYLKSLMKKTRRPAAAAVTPDDDPAQDEQEEEEEADGDPA